jgi:hypothetical protein
MTSNRGNPWWVVALAVAALAASLWLGWSDFDPYVAQETVRETIRATPRALVQLVVQFVVPVLLLGFLVREFASRRTRARA